MKKQFFELKEGWFYFNNRCVKDFNFFSFFSSQEVNVMKPLHSKFIASLVAHETDLGISLDSWVLRKLFIPTLREKFIFYKGYFLVIYFILT